MESSTTYLGQDGGAISDCELTQSQSIDEVGEALASPAPTLEDAMQRLAETIKEFDSHALTGWRTFQPRTFQPKASTPDLST